MAKRRGYPDRRGMGAQSDFISEQFVPSDRYKAQQMAMARTLIAAGVSPEKAAGMFHLPFEVASCEAIQDVTPKER